MKNPMDFRSVNWDTKKGRSIRRLINTLRLRSTVPEGDPRWVSLRDNLWSMNTQAIKDLTLMIYSHKEK